MKYCDENVSETNYSTEEIQKVFELFDRYPFLGGINLFSHLYLHLHSYRDGSGEIDSRELASVLNTFGSLLTEDVLILNFFFASLVITYNIYINRSIGNVGVI
jgi:hypothetical protein